MVHSTTNGRMVMNLRASCAAIAFVAAFPVAAQTAADPEGPGPRAEVDAPGDEIVVTGLRAGLNRAIDTKRNSDIIVDSIASEDLGKFPDTNVAESLQRITGVSVDRSGGEGQFISVRGFGPQFNTVLVNGRSIATENAGRAFSFDLLAAELISGADVYKSSNAGIQDGGIGATINIKTARPLDYDGQKIILSGQANYEQLADEFAGDGFALYSNTSADGRLGILASVSYQRRKALVNTVATNGYYRTNLPLAGLTNVNFAQNYDQISDAQDRERIGVNGTVQFEASDKVLLTVDGLWNKFTVDSTANSVGHFFSPGSATSATVDGNNTVTSFSQNATGHTDYINRTFNRPTELVAFGANLQWSPSDLIDVTLDSSYSKATSNNGGNEIFAVIGFNNAVTFNNTGSGLPDLTAANGFVDTSVGRAHFATREGFDRSEEKYENRLDATFRSEGGFIDAVKVGAYFQDLTKRNTLVRTEANVGCAYCGYAIPVGAGLLQPFNPGNFFNNAGGNFPRQWLQFNAEDYFTFLESTAAANAQDLAVGRPVGSLAAFLAANNGYDAIVYPDSFAVKERVIGGYVQSDFKSEIGGLPISGNFGVRYTRTRVNSRGSQQELLDLRVIANDTTSYTGVFSPTAVPVTRITTYDNFLPSFNAKIDFSDDVIGRFAASQTVTRPDLSLLAPRVSFTNLRPGNLQAAGGNPELNPYKSTNFDLTGEWYYQPGGYFTVSAFYKRVQDFVGSSVAVEPFTIANADNIFPGGAAPFNVQRPRNLGVIDVYGVEVGFQHNLTWLPAPFDGFGVTANATFVDSSSATTAAGNTLALEGLGNSQNAVLFYEKSGLQARLAYNHRDEFIQTLANGTGGQPIFFRGYGQFDASASYELTPYATLFVEGVNITNAKTRTRGEFDNQFLSIVDTGARYSVGARFNF